MTTPDVVRRALLEAAIREIVNDELDIEWDGDEALIYGKERAIERIVELLEAGPR